MNFHETNMGRRFFEHQVPQLIDAVKTLADVLAGAAPAAYLPAAADPNFLSDLYFGRYEPGVYRVSKEIQRLDRAVSQAHTALMETLTKEGREMLDAYEADLLARNSAVFEQAYESGVRAAVQMIAAGLSQPAPSSEAAV